ncbi:hypothetical protein CATMQ487_23260 [Sphaerotilus microaerophilus]|uniref:Uncharacterized protein n=1 Tax=Sphaerotilus microaerophilus TaxID=2914710 RepID=A0ABN6PJR5_9BURK|nr:hypothetical protein CATMQ487_23260 [Sphaerotilus sp. FB-5]
MGGGLVDLLAKGHRAQADGGDVQVAASEADKFHGRVSPEEAGKIGAAVEFAASHATLHGTGMTGQWRRRDAPRPAGASQIKSRMPPARIRRGRV